MFVIFRFKSGVVSAMILQACMVAAAAQTGPVVEVNPGGGREAVALDDAGTATPVWRLPVAITLTALAGYDENVTTSSDQSGSAYATSTLTAAYEFGTSRTRGSLRSVAGLSYYADQVASPINPNLNLALSVNHAVNIRLSVVGNFDVRYQIEPDFEINGSLNRRSGNYFYTRDGIAASYQWLPRISTTTSYSFETLQYDDSILGSRQDRVSHYFSEQVSFLLLPATALTSTYALSLSYYDIQDAVTHSLFAGVNHTVGPHLNASAQAGAQFRFSDAGMHGGDTSGTSPYFNGELAYVLGAKTSLHWSGRYSLGELGSVNSSASRTLQTGLRLQYQLTARIGANLATFYRQYGAPESPDQLLNDGISSEDAFDISVGASYAIHRRLSATANYHFTSVQADEDERSYSRSRYSIGFTTSF